MAARIEDYPTRALEDAYVFLMLGRADTGAELCVDDVARPLLDRFARRIGVEADESPRVVIEKIDRYFDLHPVSPRLLEALAQLSEERTVRAR